MKLVLFFFILFLNLSAFSQSVQVYEARPANSQPKSDDEFEALERELAEQNKNIGSAQNLLDIEEDPALELKKDKDSLPQNTELFELQAALNKGVSGMDIIQDPLLRKKLMKAYEVNPMSLMPKETVEEMLKDQLQGSSLETLTQKIPFIFRFLVNFMHHPKALGQSVKILDRPGDLKKCGVTSLILLVLVIFFRRGFLKHNPPIGKVIVVKLSSSMIFLCSSMGFFYFTFTSELAPLIEVLRQSF